MDSIRGGLTVFFDDPFWVGVFSVTCGGKLCASRVVFGAEPRDGEVYDFIKILNSVRLSEMRKHLKKSIRKSRISSCTSS